MGKERADFAALSALSIYSAAKELNVNVVNVIWIDVYALHEADMNTDHAVLMMMDIRRSASA